MQDGNNDAAHVRGKGELELEETTADGNRISYIAAGSGESECLREPNSKHDWCQSSQQKRKMAALPKLKSQVRVGIK